MKPTPRIAALATTLAAPDPARRRRYARSTITYRVLAGLLLAACGLPVGASDTSSATGVEQLLASAGKADVPASSPLAGEIGKRIAEQVVMQVGQQLVERQQLAQTGDARSGVASTAALNLAPAVAGARQPGAASKGGRQDPLRPASTAAAGGSVQDGAAGGLRVTVVGKTRRLAIIDGQVLQSGASIGGATITSIASGVVKLQRDETTETLDVATGVDKSLRPPAGARTHPRSTRRWRQASPEHEDRQ
ncbi:hypothetical protein [Rhodocyclus purpureus]|uniref:hypothetical protein n=1 Tax=Rhodocyclus purpureus TaxID=1067 RepID=UPI001911CBF0|nr:hypothetical protein [Rhodocyclus purpureus]MBK5913800.1 hypothetical protein [Rhodocyclus purpureus]